MSRSPDPLSPPGTQPGSSSAATARSGALRLALGLLGLLACLIVLGVLADDVREQEASALDALANPFFHQLASPWLDRLMEGATFLGGYDAIGPVLVVVGIWLLLIRRPRELLFVLVAIAGSVALNQTLKLIFHRPRPQLAWASTLPDFSFPSGHAMNSLVLYLALAIVVWQIGGRRIGRVAVVLAVVLAIAIGVSRIYLGYHYLTDVVAGFAAAILWLAMVVAVFRGPGLLRRRLAR